MTAAVVVEGAPATRRVGESSDGRSADEGPPPPTPMELILRDGAPLDAAIARDGEAVRRWLQRLVVVSLVGLSGHGFVVGLVGVASGALGTFAPLQMPVC